MSENRQGQATLELTAALILIMLFLVGSVRIFVWLNERMAYRQADYEGSRVSAGSAGLSTVDLNDQAQTNGMQIDESSYPELNIFS